jgi:glycosyltransferase involved in cell wall biosynthesis
MNIKANENQHVIACIASSGLFDSRYYSKQSSMDGNDSTLIAHYINYGEAGGLSPSTLFDPKLYELANPDVKSAKINLLYHYVVHGRSEGRFANAAEVRSAAKYLKAKRFFDPKYYDSQGYKILIPDLDPVEEQLVLWRLGRNPNSNFDASFYASFYSDVVNNARSPMHHYLEIGQKQNRITNRFEFEKLHKIIDLHLDRRYYLSQVKSLDVGDDLATHYLSRGALLGFNPSPDFSTEFYIRNYPDILGSGFLPYQHFVMHGRHEGRKGAPDFGNSLQNGSLDFDPNKPTLIIANHEASRTGAPLVGLNLARSLHEKYNIITMVGVVRGIQEYFLESACFFVSGVREPLESEFLLRYLQSEFGAEALLLNSAETSPLAQAALNVNLPVVALVHEFAEYTKPASRIADIARLCDYVVVPARLIEESTQKEVYTHCSGKAPNIVVRPQGALPWVRPEEITESSDLTADDIIECVRKRAPAKTKFVLGAGHVHIRKGVDLFIQTAAEVEKIRNDIAFLWVGDGYFPETDLNYSIWLKEMIDRMGLEDSVFFFPPQTSLSTFYKVSDLFFLSSRLDPFPNVILDALQADKFTICFDNATGSADMFKNGEADGVAVAHCDTSAAAAAIAIAVDKQHKADKNANLIQENFCFEKYSEFVADTISQAKRDRAARNASVDYLLESQAFDPVLYTGLKDGRLMLLPALRDYVAGSSKGLSRRNPMRGFSENLYIARHGLADNVPALERALRDAGGDRRAIKTHRCVEVGQSKSMSKFARKKLKILLHIHAHYPDEIATFVKRLNACGVNLDIVATATSQTSRIHTEYLLSNYKAGRTKTVVVRNIGRDIGPFLTEVPREVEAGSYDIIGHLHTKKSLAWNAQSGASWRDYLLDTLIGDNSSALEDIIQLFASDDSLGLVFPDDGFNVGWSGNVDHVRSIAAKFPGGLPVPERPFFPIGNMFWARTAALKPLWDLQLSNDDFPPEPLPYDGSVLHAIERLTPSVCESSGFNWATVFVDGVIR